MLDTLSCPACGRPGKSRVAVLLHFRQALQGRDPIWDPTTPHTRWARSHGLDVQQDGYFFDGESLKRVLYDYFDKLH